MQCCNVGLKTTILFIQITPVTHTNISHTQVEIFHSLYLEDPERCLLPREISSLSITPRTLLTGGCPIPPPLPRFRNRNTARCLCGKQLWEFLKQPAAVLEEFVLVHLIKLIPVFTGIYVKFS